MSDKIDAYKIVSAETLGDLTLKVNSLIDNSWEPLGAPFISMRPTATPCSFYQAMIKYSPYVQG